MSKIKKKYLDFEVYEKSEITTISGDIVAQIPSDFDDRYYTESEITTWRNGVTQTEMGYLHGVTSDIQTQLNNRLKINGSTSITGNWDIDGSHTLYIDKTNSRIGVGTASPGKKLEVVGTISGTNGLFKNTYVGEVGTGFAGFCYEGNDNYNDYALLQGSDGTTYINAVDLKYISLRINNSEKLQILSTGVRVSNGVFVLPNGTSINEFSTDGTLSGNSDNAVPTEKAIKTYVDGLVGGGSSPTNVPYGYSMGGATSGDFSTIDRITFPFDSGTASHVGNLSGVRSDSSGCNSSNYGFSMGGYSPYLSTIDRITFPFDSGTASHVGNLSVAQYDPAGCNSSNYGYTMGGFTGDNLSTIDRILFPFDSGTASNVGNLSGTRCYNTGCNSSNYGYSMGGYNRSTTFFSTIDRITFPFDSGTASHVGNLSDTIENETGCNSSNYGYSMGGYSGSSYLSTIDRILFPFDSGTASHVGNLSGVRSGTNGCNSSNYGYCLGGFYISTYYSIIDRITFPFDSGTASHVGNLSGARFVPAGCDGTDFVNLFV